MYICVCKAVSDTRIRDEVAMGATHLRDLQRNCGLGTCCGKCVPLAREVLQEAIAEVQVAAQQAQIYQVQARAS